MKGIEYTLVEGKLSAKVTNIAFDSRKVTKGSMFGLIWILEAALKILARPILVRVYVSMP